MNNHMRRSIAAAAEQGARSARQAISSPREDAKEVTEFYSKLIASVILGWEISQDEYDRCPRALKNQCRWQGEQLRQDIESRHIEREFAIRFLRKEIQETKNNIRRFVTPGSVMSKLGTSWMQRGRFTAQTDEFEAVRADSLKYLTPYHGTDTD